MSNSKTQPMQVLVTGASGFLGRTVVTQLLADGHRVRTFQRSPSKVEGAHDVLGSITEPEHVNRAVEGVEAVLHLAAKVSLTGIRQISCGSTSMEPDAYSTPPNALGSNGSYRSPPRQWPTPANRSSVKMHARPILNTLAGITRGPRLPVNS